MYYLTELFSFPSTRERGVGGLAAPGGGEGASGQHGPHHVHRPSQGPRAAQRLGHPGKQFAASAEERVCLEPPSENTSGKRRKYRRHRAWLCWV
jgi:hypothetical protein